VLEILTKGFASAREKLGGVRELTEENIDQSLRDVRTSLLEADVDLGVARDFLARVKERSLGEKVATRVRDASGKLVRVTPGQHFVKVCEEELVDLMGPVDSSLAQTKGVTSLMLVGLQGVGKTTVAAKLASHLKKQNRRPLLVAADIYRPAAILQLQQLASRIEVDVFVGDDAERPASICARAKQHATAEGYDAIIYDTAGRLAIDGTLMEELAEITKETSPANTLLVCDALMGRDAVNTARAFGEQLAFDGLVLTKLDGDARGGAALAIKAVTGVPIKFLGTGESLDRLEAFRPEGLASRILGMGDIVGLVKDFEEVVDEKEAEEDAERLLRGRFGLDDLLKQLRTIQKMGPLRDVFAKLPMFGSIAEQVDERELSRVEALIQNVENREGKRAALEGCPRIARALHADARNDVATRERRNARKDPGAWEDGGRGGPRPDGAARGISGQGRQGATRSHGVARAPEGQTQTGPQGAAQESEALTAAESTLGWTEGSAAGCPWGHSTPSQVSRQTCRSALDSCRELSRHS